MLYNWPMQTQSIAWNPNLKLILSDVDETVADLYMAATPEMIKELITLLEEGKVLFFITGQGLKSVQWRIIDQIPQPLRKHILVGPCSGVEVWGHDANGELLKEPFYSLYDEKLNEEQKKTLRKITQQLTEEFKLNLTPTMPVGEFEEKYGDDVLAVMYEDRTSQITFEFANAYDLSPEQAEALESKVPATKSIYDLRIPFFERAEVLLKEQGLPVTPRLGGMFAVDFAVEGVSKTTAVKHVLHDEKVLADVGLTSADINNPQHIEVWGDKFSTVSGGTDRHMSEAVDQQVRSIDFRNENPAEFLRGYNTVVWNGEKHLHEGLLEFLQSRKK
jgi:hydroxymethylpyrimidine pyrophosphatase-like HAD family hydrolase